MHWYMCQFENYLIEMTPTTFQNPVQFDQGNLCVMYKKKRYVSQNLFPNKIAVTTQSQAKLSTINSMEKAPKGNRALNTMELEMCPKYTDAPASCLE